MPHPKGGYRLSDGSRVPGVTTIIGRFKDSGGLLWWAYEQGKCAERGEINNLYDKRDEAADAGTLAHAMVEAHIEEKEPPDMAGYPEEIAKQAQMGFENYIRWARNNHMYIERQEMELVSEAFGFGGCPDAVGRDADGRLCLLDWKTSNGVYSDYLIQLAAYKHLWEINYPTLPITGGFHLCRFSKEHADFAHHYWQELDLAWEQFMLLRRAYDLDKLLKKRV